VTGSKTALRLTGVVKRFDKVTALDGLDLAVGCGQVFGLLGPNRSRKTTALPVALGITLPDSGSVEVLGGVDPHSVRDRIGYMPEERGLYARMGVAEQLAFFATLRGMAPSQARRSVDAWLERLGLADRAHSLAGELSKGMQQKIQVAAALVHAPDLVVLDEPASGLDPLAQLLLDDLIAEQARRATVVLSTHRLEQAEAICDSIALVHRGKVVLEGRVDALRAAHAGASLRSIFLETVGGEG